MRNRIMEALEVLASGNAGVRNVGAVDFFEIFYDFSPYHETGQPLSNSAISEAEWAVLGAVRDLMDEACSGIPVQVEDAELIASGWPDRIRPTAEMALSLMRERGRFSEDVEEAMPSTRG